MSFNHVAKLIHRFRDLNARRVFFKQLAENDNSKQQIYLGGNFEVLSFFPCGTVTNYPEGKYPNFKARIELYWVNEENIEQASGAQLILYPQYPEVRLSGFLQGCKIAPRYYLQPIPAANRKGIDGRVLFFATTGDGKTLAHLALSDSPLALEAIAIAQSSTDEPLFVELPLTPNLISSRELVLDALRKIHTAGFHPSMRLNSDGVALPYKARNGGGYTLEALLGIRPNSKAAPDFHGWEIKAFSSDRITLMTPEPNGGFYGSNGVEAFVRKYGHKVSGKDQLYFTGTHRHATLCEGTGLTLGLTGYDVESGKITGVCGGIYLLDANGNQAALWEFSHLLTHWNKKHAAAAYVRYESDKIISPQYHYCSPAFLGEHTDFTRYLAAIATGNVIFDPGSKVDNASTKKSQVKARSQFRIHKKYLSMLYETFEEVSLD